MGGTKRRELSPELARAQERFAAWRQARAPKSRIPQTLWDLAVELAASQGLHRTARALKLDYYALKERVEATPKNRKRNTSAFLELPQVALPSKECVIELGNGEELVRIRLTGYDAAEIVAVGRGLRDAS
jgi:hypothetical protein